MSIKEYCLKHLTKSWPKCPSSGYDVGYKISGKGISLSRFKQGRVSKASCPNFAAACEKFSIIRSGEGNPMFGKPPWNKGKDKRNPSIKAISEARTGVSLSQETRKRQSDSAKRRKIHGHTGRKHSPKTIKKLRENTARLWAQGRFNLVSSIHLKMREFLKTLSLVEKVEEEFQVKYFSMDFALQKAKVAIECQGTYFHVDPRKYPSGPIDDIQRRNYGRDKAKNKICSRDGWTIIPCWETEINNGEFKKDILCKLSELNLLKT